MLGGYAQGIEERQIQIGQGRLGVTEFVKCSVLDANVRWVRVPRRASIAQRVVNVGSVESGLQQEGVVPPVGVDRDVDRFDAGLLKFEDK